MQWKLLFWCTTRCSLPPMPASAWEPSWFFLFECSSWLYFVTGAALLVLLFWLQLLALLLHTQFFCNSNATESSHVFPYFNAASGSIVTISVALFHEFTWQPSRFSFFQCSFWLYCYTISSSVTPIHLAALTVLLIWVQLLALLLHNHFLCYSNATESQHDSPGLSFSLLQYLVQCTLYTSGSTQIIAGYHYPWTVSCSHFLIQHNLL